MACLTSTPGVFCSAISAAAPSSLRFSKSSTARFHVAPVSVKPLTRKCNMFIVRSSSPKPETDLEDKVAESITAAIEVCKGNETSEECVVAWDETEELAAALADRKRQKKNVDPLEAYCAENPETDECRVYED